MARNQYWVQYISGAWRVRHAQVTLSSHDVKADAIDAGDGVAGEPAELAEDLSYGRHDRRRANLR